MKNKIFLTFIVLFFGVSAFAQDVPPKATLNNVIDTIGIFSKMSDTLDHLKYRPADNEAFFGFYLLKKMEIPFTMREDTDYIILISTYDQQKLKIKLANASDRITFASTESNKVYMKYHSPVKKTIILSIEDNTNENPVVTVVMFFCRDKNSISLPFDDITGTLREMSNSSECSNKQLTARLPIFLIGGTVKSKQNIQYTLPFDISDSNVCYNAGFNNRFTQQQNSWFGYEKTKEGRDNLYFVVDKSKTVSDLTTLVYRGNGIDFKKVSDKIIGFSHDFDKKGSYQIEAINVSPMAFEHGLLFLAAFDK